MGTPSTPINDRTAFGAYSRGTEGKLRPYFTKGVVFLLLIGVIFIFSRYENL
jgi:hypothetical protein